MHQPDHIPTTSHIRPHFGNDYHRTAHPRVLEELVATTKETFSGYGLDHRCEQTADLIRHLCHAPQAGVHFMTGGTQVNTTAIAATLRPWQAVISADSGHINVHETGSVEHAGHKILTLAHTLGKITATQISDLVTDYRTSGVSEHASEPKMVYLSQPTEYDTLYSLAELKEIREVCNTFDLFLLIDGARLGYALGSPANDISLAELAQLADMFTIGGTKCGAAFDEAIVFPKPGTDTYFRNNMKQNSGLLAKGWLLGAQFQALMSDNLYVEINAHANKQAQRIAQAFHDAGISLLFPSPTNQQFALLTEQQEQQLSAEFICQFFGTHGNFRVTRFCTSWATEDADIEKLIAAIKRLAPAN
ncbi:L-threonine aldolase [Corynebacterium kutscheri]|uniref:Threonine aldolase n=1 Tax=Corynebacterium kutscheri TaxID=35755 RepID=A0A0F6R2X9_9CORY|nr:beta-eliminating lyase-related protein [Corynebacterium kutscheri]AKE41903.1 L-threonine aldolase [Corynebacterium kutscheri]VEH06492.1 Threonine aldolase [Corynebacterium kutscheri]VEH10238.1 Threonine aldolase [Corynebacterium kutscheri]